MQIAKQKTNKDTLALRVVTILQFKEFVNFWHQIIHNDEFEWNDATEAIADVWQNIGDGVSRYCHSVINIPPRSGKTQLAIYGGAWLIARNPRSNNIYVTLNASLAQSVGRQTREVIENKNYRILYGVVLTLSKKAADNFVIRNGGESKFIGVNGKIAGRGAGMRKIPTHKYCGGAIVIDDLITPEDSLSATLRNKANDWFTRALITRVNSHKTPIMVMGHRIHEDDIFAYVKTEIKYKWHCVKIANLRDDGTVVNSTNYKAEDLIALRDNPKHAHMFWSQHQQEPISMGDVLFVRDDFKILSALPKFKTVFIINDCAETDNKNNDPNVFSCFGLFEIELDGRKTGYNGLMWLDCWERWLDPTKLLSNFLDFYASCESRFGKISQVRTENKSMGVALNAFLQNKPGLVALPIIRDSRMSKMDRISEAQPAAKSGLICFLKDAKHKEMCIIHMEKITKTGAATHYDIADTYADAVKLALIDNVMEIAQYDNGDDAVKDFMANSGRGVRVGTR